ncbi:capsid protein [Facklamia sp. P13064]|uniref:capsid protein n=1 Tax=Facklamia sp. P13064 TaxID=3421953 RepID=UPI003D169D1C
MITLYTQNFVKILPDIYAVKSLFLSTFGGALQVKDGVSETDKFMELKTIDADVTIQDYSTDANVGFLTGTGNTTRFGPRKEIKAVNSQIEYEAPLAIHEGIDNMTVNENPQRVIAERLAKHAEAWTEHINAFLSKALSDAASETLTGELTEGGVAKVFSEAHAKFVNNKVDTALVKRAYVSPAVFNLIMESKLTTTAKHSSADIDNNTITKFKGFVIEELADSYFQSGENVMFAVDNVGVVGVGVHVARTYESEDFAGVALQGAAKYAKHIPEKNNKGILKATLTEAGV